MRAHAEKKLKKEMDKAAKKEKKQEKKEKKEKKEKGEPKEESVAQPVKREPRSPPRNRSGPDRERSRSPRRGAKASCVRTANLSDASC